MLRPSAVLGFRSHSNLPQYSQRFRGFVNGFVLREFCPLVNWFLPLAEVRAGCSPNLLQGDQKLSFQVVRTQVLLLIGCVVRRVVRQLESPACLTANTDCCGGAARNPCRSGKPRAVVHRAASLDVRLAYFVPRH